MKTLMLFLVLLVATPVSALTRYGFEGVDDRLFPGSFWVDETAPLTHFRTLPVGPQPWGAAAEFQSPENRVEGLFKVGPGIVHFEGPATLYVWDSFGVFDGPQGPACYSCVSDWQIYAHLTGSAVNGITPIGLALSIYAEPGTPVMGLTPPAPMVGNPPIYVLFWSDGHWDFGYWTLRPDQQVSARHLTTVPEPATGWLLIVALAGLALSAAFLRPRLGWLRI